MFFEAILVTVAHTLAEVQVKRPADTLCDGKALELVEVLAFMLAGGQEICLHATRGRSKNNADISSYVKRGQSDGRGTARRAG